MPLVYSRRAAETSNRPGESAVMAVSPVFPRVHPMAACDDIQAAGEQNVYHLIGVRTGIRASEFPYSHPMLCVYVQATGHQGVASSRVVMIRAETDEEVVATPDQPVQFHGPLNVVIVPWW